MNHYKARSSAARYECLGDSFSMLHVRENHSFDAFNALVACCVMVSCARCAPTGLDLFVNACQFSGANPRVIWSGFADYEMEISISKKSEAEIDATISEEVGSLQKVADSQKDAKTREHIESIIKLVPKTIKARNTGVRRSRIRFLFDGNSYAGKKRFEIANFDPATGKWEKPVVSLRGNATKQRGDNVVWDEAASLATVADTNFGANEFQEFGRMRGPIGRLALGGLFDGANASDEDLSPEAIEKFKRLVAASATPGAGEPFRLTGEAKYDGNAIASIVETTIKNERNEDIVIQRYWIDPSRGYVCPLIQLFDKFGKLTMEWKSSNYFLDEQSGLWFPEAHTYSEFEPGLDKLRERQKFEVNRSSVWFNRPVADNEFSIELPVNAKIMDVRHTPPLNYRPGKRITLSLNNIGLGLEKVIGTAPVAVHQPGATAQQNDWRKIIFIGVNVAIVVALLILLGIKRRRHTSTLLLLLCVTLAGCSTSSDGASLKVVRPVAIIPSIIDFGQVREASENLELGFKIRNESADSVKITNTISACGCTAPKLSATLLRPKEQVHVPVSVRIRDRLGSFASNILVYTSASKEPIVVPIQGRVVKDIWCDTPVIRCSVNESDKLVRGTFTIHTIDWPKVQFNWRDLDNIFTVEEESRTQSMNETVIEYVFTMRIHEEPNGIKKDLTLKPLDNHIRPLKLAVVCYGAGFDAHKSCAELRPQRIGIGIVDAGGDRRFALFGEPTTLDSLKVNRLDGFPNGVSVELDPYSPQTNRRSIAIRTTGQAAKGVFSGAVHFTTANNPDIAVVVEGQVTSITQP